MEPPARNPARPRGGLSGLFSARLTACMAAPPLNPNLVEGLGLSGFGFRVSDFGFRVSGFGLRVSSSGFAIQSREGQCLRRPRFGSWVEGFRNLEF